ncbi:MAG: sulfotransferase family 2 domain-containing protein [Chitinophagales bacterium]
MIISHKHKFIFVKTKKTAGTSIEIALSKICGNEDIITSISQKDEIIRKEYSQRTAQNDKIPINKYSKFDFIKSLSQRNMLRFYNHMPCSEIKRFVSKQVWDDYYKFTIDRNPFDKVVSLYYWSGGDKKFNGIYEFLISREKETFVNFNSFDIYTINDIVAVDTIYKYENINSICSDIAENLQLKETLALPTYKAKSHTRKVNNYRDVLDEKSIELIKNIFAREIKLLGYEY